MTVAFLGPQASFTQLACAEIFPNAKHIPQSSIRDCFIAVQNGDTDKAVVPLENSIEGTVSMTLDYLYNFEGIYIIAEVVLPIAHHLMIHPSQNRVEKIISHPQALAQTFHFCQDHYKDVPTVDYSSTAAAAKWVSEHPDEAWGAIANTFAAKCYGLKIIHSNVQDFEQNHTRFIVISRHSKKSLLNFPEVEEKSSLLINLPEDHAGGLHQVLSVFAWRKMNLSKIESRTLKTGLGNYFFYINVVGDWENILFKNSLEELTSIGAQVRFIGHYHEYLLEI